MADMDILSPTNHIREQAIWRLSQIAEKAPECMEEGECRICGCDINGKVFEDRRCEGLCYPVMMNAGEWEDFKKTNKIAF